MKTTCLIAVVLVIGMVAGTPLPQASPLCDVCMTGIGHLQNILGSTRLVRNVKKIIGFGCWFSRITDCSAKSQAVIDAVVEVVRDIDAKHVCSKISDCTDDGSGDDFFDIVDNAICDACKTKYDHVHAILEEYPEIKSNIKKAVGAVCLVPFAPCDAIVAAVDNAFAAIEQSSEEICMDIKFC